MPTLAEKNKCTGCMSCMNACPKAAIDFKQDEEGFIQPSVDNYKCVECGLCERSCPEIQNNFHTKNNNNIEVYAGWNKTDRCISSSGGAFSSIARYVIGKGGIVYGSSLDENLICHHIGVDSIGGLNQIRGSKYIQSDIGLIFTDIKNKLIDGNLILFTGTPCQVSGLYSYLGKEYKNLITIDLICHGVPSNFLFLKYISKLESRLGLQNSNRINKFEFRIKNGWGVVSSISNDKFRSRTLFGTNALFMSAFDKASLFRQCCYQCHYSKINRTGDFTIGDFWGLGHQGTPFKHDMTKGVSLVLANSKKGKEIMSSLGEDNFYVKRSINEAVARNHNLTKASECPPNRDAIIKGFLNDNMNLDDIEREYHITNKSLKSKVSEICQRIGIYRIIKKIYNQINAI